MKAEVQFPENSRERERSGGGERGGGGGEGSVEGVAEVGEGERIERGEEVGGVREGVEVWSSWGEAREGFARSRIRRGRGRR